jgi:high-affinity Fe2+/Pb2+ permease
MSLRAFHIVFIIVTVVLSLYVAMWGIRQGSLWLGITFLVAAAGLIIYGKKAYTKLRELP